ncbi:hypothetical protein PF005_g11627 [Phytophthora fragariae]|uniref:Uncharacterized protein n=1 Tax=Phytophthora fragariae TaxID=53985 RepID=A0A6A3EY98_9STRA|nr:hypothetical protein PF009_g12808 [Phytophthora fragariae]KAE9110549.1 hypothetical protein PF007_g11822 [Phytophthora fragariae]KAE9144226.1 hypothetical protein PF006_g10815 [Phytophthora fragariae]KAE9187654.1 hypothetical protein PF002_g25537 [Phytophthora fragariae]KAE9209941.1 hypothetical protein PF005_g11627 [Phytophthora fragariae]
MATRATTPSKRASKQPPRMIEAKDEDVDVVPAAVVVVSQMVQRLLKSVRAATESTAPAKRPHMQTPWLPGQQAPVLSKATDEAVDVEPAAAVVAPPTVQQPLEPNRAATEWSAPPKHSHKQTPWLPGQQAPALSKAKEEDVDVVPAAAVVAPPTVQQPLEPVRAAAEWTAPVKRPHKQTPRVPGQQAPVRSKVKDEDVGVVLMVASQMN